MSSFTGASGRIFAPWELEVRAVLEGAPVAAPLDRHAGFARRLLHEVGKLRVERPGPRDFAGDEHGEIDGMTGQMARLHRLGGAVGEEIALALQGAHAFG